jgi:putative MATE family efflux protein
LGEDACVPPALRPQGLWATVREAIRGTTQDLTAIPIGRAIVLVAVPTVLEMSMESLLTIVDIFFVSKLGSSAVATVGLTEAMLSPVYALAMGLSTGATAIISRRVGEKDTDGGAVAAVQVIVAALVVAALIGTVGVLSSAHLLGLMGATPDVIAYGGRYTAVMLGGSVTVFLLFVVNAIFRSAGDAAAAMRSLWLANLLNIVLAPCLIFGLGPFPRMGVVGAALATTFSRGVGVAYQVALLGRGRARLTILARHLGLDGRVLRELARLAATGTLQVLIESASWLGLVRLLSTYGSAALAGYTIAMRIAIFAMLPSWGIASAAATLVGQNLGARQPERAQRSVETVALVNLALLGIVGAVFVAAPHAFVGLMSSEPDVDAYAASCLRTVGVGFAFFGFGMVAVQAFNGAGDTLTPMALNFAAFWLFKLPLAYALSSVLGMGPRGVFIAITAAYALQAVVGGALFRRGRWKRMRVG